MEEKKQLTAREMGRMGGLKTASTHGHDFYVGIGRKGGSKGGKRTSELARKGREAEEQ